jgi:hypothetical protein
MFHPENGQFRFRVSFLVLFWTSKKEQAPALDENNRQSRIVFDTCFSLFHSDYSDSIIQCSVLQFAGIILIYIKYVVPAPALKAVDGCANNGEKDKHQLPQLKQI